MKPRYCCDCFYSVEFSHGETIMCKLKINIIKLLSKRSIGCQLWKKKPKGPKISNNLIKKKDKNCKTCQYEIFIQSDNRQNRYCNLYNKNIYHPNLPCRDWKLKEKTLGRCVSCKRFIFEDMMPPNYIQTFFQTGICNVCQSNKGEVWKTN